MATPHARSQEVYTRVRYLYHRSDTVGQLEAMRTTLRDFSVSYDQALGIQTTPEGPRVAEAAKKFIPPGPPGKSNNPRPSHYATKLEEQTCEYLWALAHDD